MTSTSLERFSIALNSLLARVRNYCAKHEQQPFGLCIANPKRASVGVPTPEIQAELEARARKHFCTTRPMGVYFRYFTPPVLPVDTRIPIDCPVTADDYQLTFELPQFDEKWQRATVPRSLIYCPEEDELHEWNEWFEIQLEAIRFTPLLHHALKQCEALGVMRKKLEQAGLIDFEEFIYEYALTDLSFPPVKKDEQEKWKNRRIDWRIRYKLIVGLFNEKMTPRRMYSITHNKAVSSQNPMIKSLLWGFLGFIEKQLIVNTDLMEDEKKRQIANLRKLKPRKVRKGKYVAKRPAVCISDVECASVLYSLIGSFGAATKKSAVIAAEAIIFIWIAQHAAFSDLDLKVNDLLAIKVTDIRAQDLVIKVKGQGFDITEGLKDILFALIDTNQKRLFQKLTYG